MEATAKTKTFSATDNTDKGGQRQKNYFLLFRNTTSKKKKTPSLREIQRIKMPEGPDVKERQRRPAASGMAKKSLFFSS
ncbi:MAG: hypothetical protein HY892_10540 [Deltaproteobacteria bacterium]|nr:hypothetical protein [Deltaproteobacteria bacterium]